MAPTLAWSAPQGWRQNLSSSTPGNFPLPRDQKAEYSFGWSKFLYAGEAEAVFTKPGHDLLQLQVKGGSTGLVRDLWKLDATEDATAQGSTLRPVRVKQVESYSAKTITTSLRFNDRGVLSLRTLNPPDLIPPREQKFLLPHLYDLQTALLYIRSRRLHPGDKLSIPTYPANAPYLASVLVIGREKIQVKAGKYNALKLELRLQKINAQLALEPHKKFKRAFAWISDDPDRLLLRVEAEIFVGSVWVELQSVQFLNPQESTHPDAAINPLGTAGSRRIKRLSHHRVRVWQQV